MTAPGSAGLRLHWVCGVPHSSLPLLLPPTPLPPSLGPASCQLSIEVPSLRALRELPVGLPAGTVVFVAVTNAEDLAALAAAASAGPPMRPLAAALYTTPAGVAAALPLVAAAQDMRLPLRCALRGAFAVAPGGDADVNTALPAVEAAVGKLADGGCPVIALLDEAALATEESLRETCEVLFALDTAGDALLERLALRLRTRALAAAARAAGVTRIDVGGLSGERGLGELLEMAGGGS